MSKDSVQGRSLGAYRMGTRLGAGGIGAVYEATHVRTGRRYAVKVLLPESTLEPNALHRFRREAEALAALGHASIVAIHDFDVTEDGVAFLVMDRLHGEDLSSRLERGALPVDEAIRIFDEVAEALICAHEAGILHRDLKPSNVFLARRPGARERAVLLDFGLAKMMEAGDAAKLTASGATMGTPMYMSPEQAQGLNVDKRTDVYSLGAILFETLTGAPPFTGPTVTAILSKVLTHPPPMMRSLEPSAPASLEPIVRAALAKGPDERPSTVRIFQSRVHRGLTGSAATTPQTQRARPFPNTAQTPKPHAIASPTPQESVAPAGTAKWVALAAGLLVGSLGIGAWMITRPVDDVPIAVLPTELVGTMDTGPSEPEVDASVDAPIDGGVESPPDVGIEVSRVRTSMRSRVEARGAPAIAMSPGLPPGTPRHVIESARSNADRGIARARRKIVVLQTALAPIDRIRRRVGSTQVRPPACDSQDLSIIGSVTDLSSASRSITQALDRLCALFDAWETPSPAVQAKIAELGLGFASARRRLNTIDDDVLSVAERDSLIGEIDALEQAIANRHRFPCGAREHARLARHADALGPRGAQAAIIVARRFRQVCAAMNQPQIAPSHRQLRQALDRTEGVVHTLIDAQQRVLDGLLETRAMYGN